MALSILFREELSHQGNLTYNLCVKLTTLLFVCMAPQCLYDFNVL
jgi:hypothetical protein